MNYKFVSNKSLGQNFLIDLNVINNIIKFINPSRHDLMIEIGPGLGALTDPMCRILDQLIAIEYDRTLADKLNYLNNLKIYVQDVLKFDFFDFFNKSNHFVRIFGNLPYNISVKLLFYLFPFNKHIVDMHFMFQKEVADRLLAIPGTKHYGRLSIIVQYYYDINFLFNVSSKSFFPIPKVNSIFLKLKPHKKLIYYVKNMNQLYLITKIAFSQRRKMIKNSLSLLFNERVLELLSIDSTMRAENLSIEQYCKLSNYIS